LRALLASVLATIDEGVHGTQAVSPSKSAHDSRNKEAAADAAPAPHDSAAAAMPPPGRGLQPAAGAKDKQPADVAEMYVGYYDVAQTESPRGKRVIDLLMRGQSPSSDESPRIKRLRGAACEGEGRGPADGHGAQGDRHGSRAHVETTRAAESSDPPAGRGGQQRCQHEGGKKVEHEGEQEVPALESAARSLEAALDRALFVLVTHSGPPAATCVAVRHALEEAGKQLRAGIDATHAGSEEEALVLVDCAFSLLARMRACKDHMSGLRAWVASEWSNVVEGVLAS